MLLTARPVSSSTRRTRVGQVASIHRAGVGVRHVGEDLDALEARRADAAQGVGERVARVGVGGEGEFHLSRECRGEPRPNARRGSVGQSQRVYYCIESSDSLETDRHVVTHSQSSASHGHRPATARMGRRAAFSGTRQWSELEYLELNGNRLVELSNGCVEVLTMPTMAHQLMVLFLYDVPQSVYRAARSLRRSARRPDAGEALAGQDPRAGPPVHACATFRSHGKRGLGRRRSGDGSGQRR